VELRKGQDGVENKGLRPWDDDRCANPRIIFRPFHAPHPSKNAQIEYIYKNIIKK
jgi:hypothetical protein